MSTQRWSAVGIIDYFVKHPKGTIFISTADMNSWLLNTENVVTIPPNSYTVVFKKSNSSGVWEGKLQFDHSVTVERGLRFK